MATFPKAVPASRSLRRTASVAEAKSQFSSLVRSVEQDRAEITVVRRGVAVARIIPIDQAEPVSGYGWMRGMATEVGDIVGPTGEKWDARSE